MSSQIKKLIFVLSFTLKAGSILATNSNNPLDAQDESGETILMVAARIGTLEEVEGIIKEGANLNIQSEKGSALTIALYGNRLEIAELLLKYEADPNKQDRWGEAPLIKALSGNRIEMTKLLLKHGANPNIKDKWDNTPLTRAIEYNNIKIAKLLIKHGADPNKQNRWGETPLMKAVSGSLIEIIKLLIENKANPFIQDNWGGAVATKETKYKKEEIKKLLEQCGKSLIESSLDFSNILKSETNINNFLKSIPSGVTMTRKQINHIEVLVNLAAAQKLRPIDVIIESLKPYSKLLIDSKLDFSNILNTGSFLENPPSEVMEYLEAVRGRAIVQRLRSKEIIPFEEKYLNIANVMHTYCNFPTDIIIDIILYTDIIAPCRMRLLYSILKQNIQ